jgi:hypothetical protein
MKTNYGEYGKLTYKDGLVMCHICGKLFKKLGAHSYNAHKIKAKDYKIMFGLMSKRSLMCQESIELARQKNTENWNTIKDNLLKDGKEYRFVKGDERIHPDWFIKTKQWKEAKVNHCLKYFHDNLDN